MSPCISVSLFLLPGRLLDKRAFLEYWRHNGARNRLRFTSGVDCSSFKLLLHLYFLKNFNIRHDLQDVSRD